mmetsp:Transcript_18326/g.23765  ORF Transcript_18326/g.23765 Transcript_18326/m.23765 type:complete len:723 (-) Transcript_18326:3-2171(-)
MTNEATEITYNEDYYHTLLSIGEECIDESNLQKLLTAKEHFIAYDGFEPSGRMHIAQGIFKAVNVNKITSCGGTFVFWVADWFALMNDKMGGDLAKIAIVGEYLQHVWKSAGMDGIDDPEKVRFILCSDAITKEADAYWTQVLDVARRFNLTRIQKCCQIMGRLENSLSGAQILYPLMQCADVFFLKTDVCQLGKDQRKVNALALEYCNKIKRKNKPVILSHHMLMGLKAGQEKMSKSDPDSAIFMEDSNEDVIRKINNAYCPLTIVEGEIPSNNDDLKNPCLDYIEHILFNTPNFTFVVNEAEGKSYDAYSPLFHDFVNSKISVDELKTALAKHLNLLLDPVRQHFTNDERAKELLNLVQQYKREDKNKKKEVKFEHCPLPNGVEARTHVIVLPDVNPLVSYSQIMTVSAAIRKQSSANEKVTLLVPDWSSFTINSLLDKKTIQSYYDVFLWGLEVLGKVDMTTLQIVTQSTMILSHPSEYWLTVMNAGRALSLAEVMMEDLDGQSSSGCVVARLMHIADVMTLQPMSVTYSVDLLNEVRTLESLITKFNERVVSSTSTSKSLQLTFLKTPVIDLRLKAEREINDVASYEYYLNDAANCAKSKMRKSFCEPGNVSFCPVIEFVKAFCGSEFKIVRKEENGGDVVYSLGGSSSTECNELSKLVDDFKRESLHPGDLKNSMATVMLDVMTDVEKGSKSNKSISNALKCLKAFDKKVTKAGKKK